jgi:PKHD-type hydroxylase
MYTDNTKRNFDWYLKNFDSVEPWVEINNAFSEVQLDLMIQIGKSNEHSVDSGPAGLGLEGKVNDSIRISRISWIKADVPSQHWIFRDLVDFITEVNEKYFNYDLVKIENLQFATYDSKKKGMYKKHIDIFHSNKTPYSRKLSFSLQLSDEDSYEGGDLNLYYEEEPKTMSKKRGTLMFFPSYTLHEVTPVTKGVRHSLVGWVEGPAFK